MSARLKLAKRTIPRRALLSQYRLLEQLKEHSAKGEYSKIFVVTISRNGVVTPYFDGGEITAVEALGCLDVARDQLLRDMLG